MGDSKKLKLIGIWKDHTNLDAPDPSWFVDPFWDIEEKNRVLQVFKDSPEFENEHLGHYYGWCRFKCNNYNEKLWRTFQTDGIYIWPTDLHHYVEQHNIRLPKEVVDSLLSLNKSPIISYLPRFDTSLDLNINWWYFQKGIQQTYLMQNGFRGIIDIQDANFDANFSKKELILEKILSMSLRYKNSLGGCVSQLKKDRGLILKGLFQGEYDLDDLLSEAVNLGMHVVKTDYAYCDDKQSF